MDYLIYGRAALEGADQDSPALDEAHWSFMDAFADRMTARGPTLSADRAAWTGSLHVVDLDDAAAARAFAVDEPYQRAGLFREHLIRRFDNRLGRTMWDFIPQADDVPFLVLADGGDALADGGAALADGGDALATGSRPQALPSPAAAARLILWGALRPAHDSLDRAGRSTGTALALSAPSEAAARGVIAAEPALLGGCTNWEIHAWQFGGRR